MALTLTQAPSNIQRTLAEIKRTSRRLLRTTGIRPQMAWTIEPHESGELHLHATVLHGERITRSAWSDAWGAPRVTYKDCRDFERGVAGWIDYSLKATRTVEGIQAHLILNGGRLIHTSRGFA
jgi:hypothetical protein